MHSLRWHVILTFLIRKFLVAILIVRRFHFGTPSASRCPEESVLTVRRTLEINQLTLMNEGCEGCGKVEI